MDRRLLFDWHEKMYFHEIESREKIAARLQVTLAILLSIASLYGYLLKGWVINYQSAVNFVFLGLFILSLILFVMSCWHFKKAFFGSEYKYLPTAKDSEDYRETLLNQYKNYDGKNGYDDCDTLVKKYFEEYVYNYYVKCSTHNAIVNDERSLQTHQSHSFVIFNVLPLAILFLMFTFTGIEKNELDREYKVKIANPLVVEAQERPVAITGTLSTSTLNIDFSQDLKDILMTDKAKTQPAPPPPANPPPVRQIKEDVNIPLVKNNPPTKEK